MWKTNLNVMYGQTDRQTTYCGITMLCIAWCGKNRSGQKSMKSINTRCLCWKKSKKMYILSLDGWWEQNDKLTHIHNEANHQKTVQMTTTKLIKKLIVKYQQRSVNFKQERIGSQSSNRWGASTVRRLERAQVEQIVRLSGIGFY